MATIYAMSMDRNFTPRFHPDAGLVDDHDFSTVITTPLTLRWRFSPYVRVVFMIAGHMTEPSPPPVVSGAFLNWRLSGTVELPRNRYAWLYEADVTQEPPEEWQFISVHFPVPGRMMGFHLWTLANTEMSFAFINALESLASVGSSDVPGAGPFRIRPRTFQGSGDEQIPFAPRRGDIFAYLVAFTSDGDNLSAIPRGTWNPGIEWAGEQSGGSIEWSLFSSPTHAHDPQFVEVGDEVTSFIDGMQVGLDRRFAPAAGGNIFTPGGKGVPTMRFGDQVTAERQRIIHPSTYQHNDPWGIWEDLPHYDEPVDWALFVWGTGFDIPKLRGKRRDDEASRGTAGRSGHPTSVQRGVRGKGPNTYV